MSDNARQQALTHHRNARRAVAEGRSPVSELEAAVALLTHYPSEQALVMLDLAVAVEREGGLPRALDLLNQAEALVRGRGEHDLLIAIRHARARIAEETGDIRATRDAWRATADALREQGDKTVATAFDDDPAARTRRARAVEDELEQLKREVRRRP